MATTNNTRRWINQSEAAETLNLGNPRTLAAWRLRRCGPPYHRLGKRLIRYDLDELNAWVAGKAVPA